MALVWRPFGPIWRWFGALLGPFGAGLAPFWAHLALVSRPFGPIWRWFRAHFTEGQWPPPPGPPPRPPTPGPRLGGRGKVMDALPRPAAAILRHRLDRNRSRCLAAKILDKQCSRSSVRRGQAPMTLPRPPVREVANHLGNLCLASLHCKSNRIHVSHVLASISDGVVDAVVE